MDPIIIKGARQNNLKNLTIEIPKNKITVFTGVSGSGKSSLVFETIGAEAQRQINETYDSYIRNRLPHYGTPDVDAIYNLNVPVIINQKRIGGNARSTVGTITDTYTLLRLLFSRMGQPFVGYSMDFSFNNPKGMCPECEGLGKVSTINIDLLIDKNKSLNEGAINFPSFRPGQWRWTRYVHSGYFDNDKKVKRYSKAELQLLLYAEEHKPTNPPPQWGKTVLYEGVIPRIERSFLKKESKTYAKNASDVADIVIQKTCPRCKGARLNEHILQCKIKGNTIADCSNMQVNELIAFLQTLKNDSLQTLIQELIKRLRHMEEIGLHYLFLNRETASLSGGESQRIKMVKNLGSSLTELLYIFDEPSIGLHQRDIDRINKLILELRNKGNTVLIVEHDPDVIKIADHIVDIGPHAGKAGGQIVYQGTLDGLQQSTGLTAQYWKQKRSLNLQPRTPAQFLWIKNASLHNLQHLSIRIPENVITVVTGVAGSGKSTLINHVLPEQYPHVKLIDQGLLRGSRRSHLASYTGIFDVLRMQFSKANKVSASLFSANAEGACPECRGLGVITLDLAFMDDVEQPCDACNGTGYKPEVLPYLYRGKNIVEVLNMTVEDSIGFFEEKEIVDLLSKISEMGLHYMTLGQSLNTFSGGERQRLKLALELDETGQLFVFDEPTTGLHPSDIKKLLTVFHRLADNGNTVIIIEHNLDVVSQADWIIDMGPGAGHEGGQIVFEGLLKDLLLSKNSKTGTYLASYLQARP